MLLGNNKYTFDSVPSQEGKHVLITGGNAGLGWSSAKMFVLKNARKVTITARNKARGERALQELKKLGGKTELALELCDQADLDDVKAFTNRMLTRNDTIDVLILNAGVMFPPYGSKTKQGLELQFGVNHVGHFALCVPLIPLVRNRIVVVSSLAGEMSGMVQMLAGRPGEPFEDVAYRKFMKGKGSSPL